MAAVDELASCRYLGWARFVRSSATLRSSPRVKVVVLRMMRVTMRLVPFSPRFDVFIDSIDEPARARRSDADVRETNPRSEQRTRDPAWGKDSSDDADQRYRTTCACVYARFSFLSSYQRVMSSVHAILIASDGNIRYLTLRNIINRGWISVERGGRASLSDDDVTAYYTALRKDSIGETLEKPPRGTYRYQRHAIGPSVQSRRFGIVIPRDTEHIYAYIRRTYISIP